MIEPNGPLPQSVYWRRRAAAAGASVAAVALLTWLIGGLVESDDQHPVQGTADTADLGGPAPAASVRASSERVSAPPSSPGPDDPRGSALASPSPTSAAPASVTTPAPAPVPVPPAACPDAVMRVAAVPDAASYPVGTRPLLKLLVVNAGPVPCTRDVNGKLREILVLDTNGTRLWSSNDCYGPPDQDVRLLKPNQPAEFPVQWAGRTSAPGCPLNRKTVLAGKYQVVGKLGPLASKPAPLVLT